MEIILLQDVDKLGKKGDLANVSEGYARNFLLPRKVAEIATPGRIANVRQIMDERAAHAQREADRAEETREMLSKTVLTITAPVGSGDRLFGSVTNQDIAEAIFAARKTPRRQAQGGSRRAHQDGGHLHGQGRRAQQRGARRGQGHSGP